MHISGLVVSDSCVLGTLLDRLFRRGDAQPGILDGTKRSSVVYIAPSTRIDIT